jgi:hypothetical protein
MQVTYPPDDSLPPPPPVATAAGAGAGAGVEVSPGVAQSGSPYGGIANDLLFLSLDSALLCRCLFMHACMHACIKH